jgi:general secretion pathway protein F
MDNPHITRLVEFDIVAKARAGAILSLRLAALDATAATRLAERDGLRVLSCVPRRNNFLWGPGRSKAVVRARLDIALFAHELAALLDAGLGIIDALDTLAEKERLSETRAVFEKMVQSLQEGRNLSSVMSDRADVFPQLLVASVAASEQTGDMSAVLRRYSANFETLRAIRSKALGAAVYPLMLLGVGTLVVLFLLAVVVPRFSTLIESTRGEIPFASQILIRLGKTIDGHPQLVAALVGGAFLLLILALRHASRAGWNLPVMQRLPIVGPLVRIFRHTQFYRTSGMLIEGGIPAVHAFDMCGALLTPDEARKLGRAVASIREGAEIGHALQVVGLADPVALRMLKVAQRTGKLAEILARIAAFQETTLTRAIDVATRLFEPVLMLGIGLVIGAIVVLMYLPIFDLASSIQ